MKDRTLSFASTGAAIAASLCCIGPLIAVALGLGTFGAAAGFEKVRPILLVITALLLASAFYLTYRPSKTAACADGVCTSYSAKRHRKAFLWIATAFAVLFAAFPYYSPLIWKSLVRTQAQPVSSQLGAVATSSLILHVEGMTCGGCAAAVQSALLQLRGVREASVSYEEKSAIVKYNPSRLTAEQIVRAVSKAGYKATLKAS